MRKITIRRQFYTIIDAIVKCMDYVIAFFIISMTASAWNYDRNLSFTFAEFRSVFLKVLIISILMCILFKKYPIWHGFNTKRMLFAGACIGIYAYFCIHNKSVFIEEYVFLFSGIIVWISLHDNRLEVWKRIVDIVLVLALVSLFFYVFGSWANIIPEYNAAQRVWGKWNPQIVRNFYYLYYESHQIVIHDFVIWKNCAFFAEAPMFNYVLCTALAAEVFLLRSHKRWKVIVLGIAILTTFSTTGHLFLLLLLCLYILENRKRIRCIQRIRPYLKYIFIAFVLAFILVLALKGISSEGKDSTNIRIDHMVACFKTFFEYTVFGCGWLNYEVVWQYAKYKQGISVGLPYFMACGGLVLSSILTIPFIHDLVYAVKNMELGFVCFEILFVMLFFFTITMQYPLFLLGLGYILVHNNGTECVNTLL